MGKSSQESRATWLLWSQGVSLGGALITISALGRFIKAFDFTGEYQTRTPSIQGGFQAAGIVVSLLMAFVGGAIVGKAEGSTERGGLSQPAAETEADAFGVTAPSTVPGLRLPSWVNHPHPAGPPAHGPARLLQGES